MASSERSPRMVAGRYDLGVLIGRGGMSEVYRARDLVLDRPVAVKVLRIDVAQGPKARDRLLHEARMAARLAHPRVVQIFDTGTDADRPFIVMEHLSGWTLRDRIDHGPLGPAEAVDAALQVLEGLEAAHRMGLVHRDVKPGNVLLDTTGGWKIADFGIARWMNATGTLTMTGELLGSPSYVAPERLTGDEGSPRGDLYGVGVLLYEAMSGRPPFGGPTPWAIAAAIRDGVHVPIEEAEPGLAGQLARAVERAMALDPDGRFGSAEAMAATLRAGLSQTQRAPMISATPTDADRGDPTRRLDTVLEPTDVLPAAPVEGRPVSHVARHAPRRPWATPVIAIVAAVVVLVLASALTFFLTAPDARDQTGPRSGPNATLTGSERLDRALDRLERAVRP